MLIKLLLQETYKFNEFNNKGTVFINTVAINQSQTSSHRYSMSKPKQTLSQLLAASGFIKKLMTQFDNVQKIHIRIM